ncbi:MAG: hypothetical protein WBM13_02040 [Bacteroidia bacterium]
MNTKKHKKPLFNGVLRQTKENKNNNQTPTVRVNLVCDSFTSKLLLSHQNIQAMFISRSK